MLKTANFFSLILLFITLCLTAPAEISAAASETDSATEGIILNGRVEVLENSLQKANFHFNLNGIRHRNVEIDGKTYRDISLNGEGSTTRPDMPKLPAVSRWIVIPNGTSIELIHRDESRRTIESDLPPVVYHEPGLEYSTQMINPENDNEIISGLYPPEPVVVSSPIRMRNIRMAQITVYPVQYNPVTGEYIQRENLDVELRFVPDQNRGRGLDFERIPSPGFQRLLESIAVNPPPHRDDCELVEMRGYYEYYLFVLPETIEGENPEEVFNQVYRLMEWKRRSGNKVDLMLAEAGTERDGLEINEQIQNYYNELLEQGIEPFDNILLIGEEDMEPPDNNSHGQGMDILLGSPGSEHDEAGWEDHWDLYYAYLEHEGDELDFIPDAAVSRFQAGNIAMLVNGMHKTLSYESEPYMEEEELTWFEKAVVEEEPLLDVGNTVVFTVDYFVYALENNNKNVVAQFRQDRQDGTVWLGQQISNRIGFIAGRAQNEDMNYFGNRQPNEYMEAVGVYPIALLNSGHGEIAMETLFWVGREFYEEPENYDDSSGAKGAVAVTCTWARSTTTPNNCLGIGMVHSMLDLRLSFGWARNWSLMNLARVYAEDEEQEMLLKYSSDFQLTGEPGICQWEGVPRLIEVEHPETLARGVGYVPVRVTDPESGAGIADIRVVLHKGTQEDSNQADVDLFNVKYTEADGFCYFSIDPEIDESIQITALEQDIYPYKGTIERVDQDVSIAASLVEINDDSGNSDGIVNLNETLQVLISASNTGNAVDAVNVVGFVTSLTEGAEIANNRTEFGNIAVGETSGTIASIDLSVNYPCSDGIPIHLRVDFESENGNWSSVVSLDPQTENLVIGNVQPGRIIDHGEQQFNLELINTGRIATSPFTTRLITSGWGIVFPEETLEFNAIQPEQSAAGNSSIVLIADERIIPGTRIPVEVILEYEGIQFDLIELDLQVDTPGEGDPTGPDAYGYYAFDNTDTEYPQCPEYIWVEAHDNADIDAEPVELNHGNNVDDFGTITLPFTFQYYGREYDTIMVSTNGFIVMGNNRFAVPNPQNWPLIGGGSGGASGVLAPFWENLSFVPQWAHLYHGYDEYEKQYVIEWYRAQIYATDSTLIFQVLLKDPAEHPTRTGDGEIIFNYNDQFRYHAGASSLETPYASVGITSPDGTTGISYSYANTYDVTAAPLEGRRSILFTTNVDDPTKAPETNVVEVPSSFEFTDIYPNPFNSTATINFSLNQRAEISLKVYDLRGRMVGLLVDGVINQGHHTAEWTAEDLSTGLYLVNLHNGVQSVTRKIALIR